MPGFNDMNRVLVFTRFYLPGYQAGGPIVSLANLISTLGTEVSFFVVTSDRDINDRAPYPDVELVGWVQFGNAEIRYLGKKQRNFGHVVSVTKEAHADVIYLNSFFDVWFSAKILLARRLGLLAPCRVVLAPRGEFSAGALAIKPQLKRWYIAALKASGLLRHIDWHASTDLEADDIRSALNLPQTAKIHIASDLGALPSPELAGKWQPRPLVTPLRVCFFSRISPMKNLLGAVRILSLMTRPARLDIFGPKEDAAYWTECERAISELPAHVSAEYRGPVTPPNVHQTLAVYDAMLFPTFGENYGHVIPEALSVGLPVVISDRTPWKGLAEKGAGYDLPLSEADFAACLDRIANLDAAEMQTMREAAMRFARSVLVNPQSVEANRRIFAV